MKGKIKGLLPAIVLVILGGLVWISRPLWHWFFMYGYVNPAAWELLVIAIIIGAQSYVIWFSHHKYSIWEIKAKEQAIVVFIAIFCLSGILLGCFQVMYPQCYLSQNLEVSEIVELPDMDPSAVRIMPMAVSQRYAVDALQYPRHRLGTGDIAFVNKTPHWVYGLIPKGMVNFFVLKDKGAVYVDMSIAEKNTRIIERDMEIGEGMGITDWYKWRLYKEKYWVNYEDPYFIPEGEELYIVVPIKSYEYHWRFPTFYTIPKWEGTVLIDSGANIEFLTPEQALEHPVLKDQKLFPEGLSRYYINSFRYVQGISNRLFYHENQLKIAEVLEQENIQPFLIVTREGMKWFIGCEPWGEETHGIFRIYLIDAREGKIQLFEQPKTETLLGPVSACDYVRKANPIIDWSRMITVEPIPVVAQGKLYWQVKIIPNDAAGIAYTAMVDSKTYDAIELKSDESVRQFIEGRYTIKPGIPPEIARNVTAIVIIRDDGREIQRIEVFQNQTIEVVIPQVELKTEK